MKIRLTEHQIKKIIFDAAKKVIKEALGAITNHLMQLSNSITNYIFKYKRSFKINPEIFNQYQAYYIADKPLYIKCTIKFDTDQICWQDSEDNDTIVVNLPYFLTENNPSAYIMHELTHLINRYKTNNTISNTNTGMNEIDYMLYLFNDTEIQARTTQLFKTLANIPQNQLSKDIFSYNDILFLSEMKYCIDTYIKKGSEFYIKLLFGRSQFIKQINNNRAIVKDFSSFNLEQQRAKLLKYYNKKYNEYLGKAIKILGFFLQ